MPSFLAKWLILLTHTNPIQLPTVERVSGICTVPGSMVATTSLFELRSQRLNFQIVHYCYTGIRLVLVGGPLHPFWTRLLWTLSINRICLGSSFRIVKKNSSGSRVVPMNLWFLHLQIQPRKDQKKSWKKCTCANTFLNNTTQQHCVQCLHCLSITKNLKVT